MIGYGENERLLSEKGDKGGESSPALRESRRLLMGCEIPPRFALVLMMGLLVGAALLRFEPPDFHKTSAPKTAPTGSLSAPKHDAEDPNVLDSLHGLKAVAPLESATLGAKLEGAAAEIELEVEHAGPKSEFEGTGTPPNVIFILLDDVGMNDLGYLSTDLKGVSPFIDKLAAEGIKIEKYYTNHICTPARAALMTGRDTFRTGMQYEEIQAYQPWSIPMDEATLAERFKAAGYSTHMVGKWNLGNYAPKCYPFNRGFDTFLGYMGAQETYYSHSWGGYKDFGFGDKDGYIDTLTNTTRLSEELEGLYSTAITGDRAIQIAHEHVANDVNEPLFMYLAFQAVHWPLNVPQDNMFTKEQFEKLSTIKSKFTRRLEFAKIMYYLDITLERVFGELDAMGMLENTLIVLASDNGGCPANGGNNYPYRGVKHTQFEGGVRVPAFVHSKSTSIIPMEARGTTYGDMMHVTDWTPTLANITGIPTTGMGNPLSGFDHWEAILNQRPEALPPVRNELVLRRNSYRWDGTSQSMVPAESPTGAYIHEGWKIVVRDKCTGWFSFSPEDEVRKPDCKVATSPLGANSCLPAAYANSSYMFNLAEDPHETHDLSMIMPDKFQEMVQRWNDASVDEIPSNYRQTDSRAFKVWAEVNDYVVAWLDDFDDFDD